MADPIVVVFFNNANAPLAGLTPKVTTGDGYLGYYKTGDNGLDATPPNGGVLPDGGDGGYSLNPSPADRVTGIRYLIDGGPGANPRFYEGQLEGVPLAVIPPPVVVPVIGTPFDPAAPPTWTAADVNTLKAAVASGVLSVSFTGPPARTVTYQSSSEMRSLLAEMIAQLKNTAGTRRSYRLARTRKGV